MPQNRINIGRHTNKAKKNKVKRINKKKKVKRYLKRLFNF